MFRFKHIIAITFCAMAYSVAMGEAIASTTVCVTNVADFQTALDDANGSTSTTFIKVARGFYVLSGTALNFDSTATLQGQLDVEGGYSDDCSTQIKNPALTVISAAGGSAVLQIQSPAGISVRYLTIENGNAPEYAGLFIQSQLGGVIVDYNIIRNNGAASSDGGFLILADSPASTAVVHLEGNLIYSNTALVNFGAGNVANNGSGSTFVTNNTIVANLQPSGQGAGGLEVSPTSGTAYVSNNVGWDNKNADLFWFNATSVVVLANNDFQVVGGTPDPSSGNNVSVDPGFVSASDFRLTAASPLLAQGTLTPPGNLPTIDIEGHPRSYNNLVDMGAYERGNEIYGNSFDD